MTIAKSFPARVTEYRFPFTHAMAISAVIIFAANGGCNKTNSDPASVPGGGKVDSANFGSTDRLAPLQFADDQFAHFQTWTVEGLPDAEIVQFESVFWEPEDTPEIRRLIVESKIAEGKKVLEIGTGTGLLALLCAQHGANQTIATEINPAAVACARFNAVNLNLDSLIEVRQVSPESPSAFSALDDSERFDLIISNPPWEDGAVNEPADHAFYDPRFELLDSLIKGLPRHLNPGGRCYLSYGNVTAIGRLISLCRINGYPFEIRDDRNLYSLPENFLPGMLIEIWMPE